MVRRTFIKIIKYVREKIIRENNALEVIASWALGMNVLQNVTLPIFWGCKSFVQFFKWSRLPWGGCR